MSRIGKLPVSIPEGVEVTLEGHTLSVSGPKGTLTQQLHPAMIVTVDDGEVRVQRPDEEQEHKALHGLTRALIQNMVSGVSEGFQHTLELVGVGYRAQAAGPRSVTLQVGYSHPVEFTAPEGIELNVPVATRIEVRGIDKQLVGQVAADLRAVRPPEPYKGKGIRYAGEPIRRKSGKAGIGA